MTTNNSFCQNLADIIGGDSQVIDNVCTVLNRRTFRETILQKEVNDPLVNIFTFEFTDKEDVSLNLGLVTLLDSEVTKFTNTLIENGNVKISSISNSSLYANPQINNVYFDSLGDPVSFAVDVRKALDTLKDVGKLPVPEPSSVFDLVCDQFAEILGTIPFITFSQSCLTIGERPITTSILGQVSNSLLALPYNFRFGCLDKNCNALCVGTIGLLQKEVNKFVKAIKLQEDLLDSTLYNRWIFQRPQIAIFEYIACIDPIVFANKSAAALEVLDY